MAMSMATRTPRTTATTRTTTNAQSQGTNSPRSGMCRQCASHSRQSASQKLPRVRSTSSPPARGGLGGGWSVSGNGSRNRPKDLALRGVWEGRSWGGKSCAARPPPNPPLAGGEPCCARGVKNGDGDGNTTADCTQGSMEASTATPAASPQTPPPATTTSPLLQSSATPFSVTSVPLVTDHPVTCSPFHTLIRRRYEAARSSPGGPRTADVRFL